MPTILDDEIYPEVTARSGRRYLFTLKHHGKDRQAARWLPDPELSRDEEFDIFNVADALIVADDRGNFYGVLGAGDGTLRTVGTWSQQVAEFPVAREGEVWHGYPIYPVNDLAPKNRAGHSCRPAKAVFERMLEVGLIDVRLRKRLVKGDIE